MWFTRVSLHNPVFATMVMLALVVLGLFSFQRLKLDQFPNIVLPVGVTSHCSLYTSRRTNDNKRESKWGLRSVDRRKKRKGRKRKMRRSGIQPFCQNVREEMLRSWELNTGVQARVNAVSASCLLVADTASAALNPCCSKVG